MSRNASEVVSAVEVLQAIELQLKRDGVLDAAELERKTELAVRIFCAIRTAPLATTFVGKA